MLKNKTEMHQAATGQQRYFVSASSSQLQWHSNMIHQVRHIILTAAATSLTVHAWVCAVKYGPTEGYLAEWERPLYVTSMMTDGDGCLWKDRPHRQCASGLRRLLIYSFNSSCSIQVLMKKSDIVQSIYSKSPGKDMSQICFPFSKTADWNPHDANFNKWGRCKLIFWQTIVTNPHVADGLLWSAKA